jgi:hypothetical protein
MESFAAKSNRGDDVVPKIENCVACSLFSVAWDEIVIVGLGSLLWSSTGVSAWVADVPSSVLFDG